MAVFQLILQVIAVCTIVTIAAIGLFSAPWYVLTIFLVSVLAITRSLMPRSLDQHKSTTVDATPSLIAPNDAQSPTPAQRSPNQPAVLTYRGTSYSKNSSESASIDPAATNSGTPVDDRVNHPDLKLKYRGAKINAPHSPSPS